VIRDGIAIALKSGYDDRQVIELYKNKNGIGDWRLRARVAHNA
jgi:hypothetical protein